MRPAQTEPTPSSIPPLRKRAARLHCEDLRSNFGTVQNISLSGASVRARRLSAPRVGEQLRFRLEGYGSRIQLLARVARFRRVGLLRYEIGVEFLHNDAATRETLSELVRCHSVRYAIVREAAA